MDADTLVETAALEGEPAKRRQILDGARRVFLADGFDGASMNDIARVAGVSKGTLYVYFESKEALFGAMIREDRKQQVERMAIPEVAADPRAPLAAFGRQLLTLMTRPETLAQVRMVIAATAKFPSIGHAFYASGPCYGVRRLAERLDSWRDAGLLAFPDSTLAAQQFFDLCKSGVFSACLFGVTEAATPEAIGATVDRAVDLFMKVYAAPAAASAVSMSLANEDGASVGA